MVNADLSTYGIVGLGVMGRNLALNVHEQNLGIAGFSINAAELSAMQEEAPDLPVFDSLEAFVGALESPRTIFLMVTAGAAVDEVLTNLRPLLAAGDTVIDGGNSRYQDTSRRARELEAEGLIFLGVGVSGGEEGARHGASLMIGGDEAAFDRVHPLFHAIACEVGDEACCGWLGTEGAGHFVKMVHNGIEYGVMQLIAETYDVATRGLQLDLAQVQAWFDAQRSGALAGYLIDITAAVLKQPDDLASGMLLDQISDVAGQKGTGRWCVEAAMEYGVPAPTIIAAVTERQISGRVETRQALAEPDLAGIGVANPNDWEKLLKDALLAGVLVTFAQGLSLIRTASETAGWGTDIATAIRLWRGGCIIRCALLEELLAAGDDLAMCDNVLAASHLSGLVKDCAPALRRLVAYAAERGVPLPAMSATLAYLDSFSSPRLPTRLIQAQRDFFGAHTFERIDRPGSFHVNWSSEQE